MLNENTTFTVKDRGESNKLIDRAIMMHFDDRLELLDISSFKWEGIVLHIMNSKKNSFLIYMVDNINLFIAFLAVGKGVIDHWSIEPSWIIEYVSLAVVLIIVEEIG